MTVSQQRLRITFAKGPAIRFSSHLDLAKVWERSLRRAGAPLAYTQGFSPRPRMQLAAALPLGHTGSAELLDIWLAREIDPQALRQRLETAVPPGIRVRDIHTAALDEAALQNRVVSADYRVEAERAIDDVDLRERVACLLNAQALPAEHKGKAYDLRPLIERLAVESVDERQGVLRMQLAARPGETARAEAVLEALGLADAFVCIDRLGLLLAPA